MVEEFARRGGFEVFVFGADDRAMASSVKLGSHNDYISQAQGCVVTLKGLKKQAPADDSQVRIVPKKEATVSADPVKVSLHDCLACSGCITTAETVMLEQQSTGMDSEPTSFRV